MEYEITPSLPWPATRGRTGGWLEHAAAWFHPWAPQRSTGNTGAGPCLRDLLRWAVRGGSKPRRRFVPKVVWLRRFPSQPAREELHRLCELLVYKGPITRDPLVARREVHVWRLK